MVIHGERIIEWTNKGLKTNPASPTSASSIPKKASSWSIISLKQNIKKNTLVIVEASDDDSTPPAGNMCLYVCVSKKESRN